MGINSLLPVFWPGKQIKVPDGWAKQRELECLVPIMRLMVDL